MSKIVKKTIKINNRRTKAKKGTIVLSNGPRRTRISMPVSRGYSVKGGAGVSYGSAPYHETFGSGLRITIHGQRVCDIEANHDRGAAHIFKYYDDEGKADFYPFAVNSMVYGTFNTGTVSLLNEGSLWGSSTSTLNPMGTVLSCYQSYCIRKLKLKYLPTCSTATGGTIVFGSLLYDGMSIEGAVEEDTYGKIACMERAVETPVYGAVSIDVIQDKDLNKACTRLYTTTRQKVVVTYVKPEQQNQLRILAAVSPLIPSATQSYGRLIIEEAVLDVYRLKGSQPTNPGTTAPMTSTSISKLCTSSCLETEMCNVTSSSSSLSSVVLPKEVERKEEKKEEKVIEDKYFLVKNSLNTRRL